MDCVRDLRRTRFKKQLGQHMLVDKRFIQKIIEAVGECRVVYEIGCGVGGLTLPLSRVAEYVFCSEIDGALIPRLRECTSTAGNIDVVNADAASLELSRSSHVVVSNTPFYLSSKIVVSLCRDVSLLFAVLGVQREVGERILAFPGSQGYGRLSVISQLCFDIKELFIIPKSAYYPRPKVDTTVLRLLPRRVIGERELKAVEVLTRAFFPYRRKKLLTGLSLGLRVGREETKAILLDAGIDPGKRVEEVTPEEVLKLARMHVPALLEHKRPLST